MKSIRIAGLFMFLIACSNPLDTKQTDSNQPNSNQPTPQASSEQAGLEGRFGRTMVTPDGEVLALPPDETMPNREDQLSAQAALDPGCISPTGPIRRIYTPSNLQVNYLKSTITLPASSGISNATATNTPYVYSGGWSNTNKALDAGLQYSPTYGNWSPFFAVEGSQTGSQLYSPKASTNPVGLPVAADPLLRLNGGQSFTYETWTTDSEIVIKISPVGTGTLNWKVSPNGAAVTDNQPRYFKYAVGVLNNPPPNVAATPATATPASLGWTTAGTGQIFKAMTTVAQTTLTNPSGSTNFPGTKWASTSFGTRNAAGVVTTKINSSTNATTLKPCAYPAGAVVPSGDLLSSTGESVTIKYVGASAASISPLSFIFRGKPGDIFNANVSIANSGPAGSLLYWCKQNATGACVPTLNLKYKPVGVPGVNGGTSETLKVTNPSGVTPSCPTDPTLATNADFKIDYQTSTATGTLALGTQAIPVTVKCTSMTFAWYNGISTFNGPNDLCRIVAAVVTVKSNVAFSSANFTAKVDGVALGAGNLNVFASSTPGNYIIVGNNHCNYAVGNHTLSVNLSDPTDTTKLLATTSGVFVQQDNRWTIALQNVTDNCAGIPGVLLSYNVSASGETTQVFTNVAIGAAVPALFRASKTYTIVTTSTGSIGGTSTWTFPTSFGAVLPLNIFYSNYGGVNAHGVIGTRTTCPVAARSTSTPTQLEDVLRLSDTTWTFKEGSGFQSTPKP